MNIRLEVGVISPCWGNDLINYQFERCLFHLVIPLYGACLPYWSEYAVKYYSPFMLEMTSIINTSFVLFLFLFIIVVISGSPQLLC